MRQVICYKCFEGHCFQSDEAFAVFMRVCFYICHACMAHVAALRVFLVADTIVLVGSIGGRHSQNLEQVARDKTNSHPKSVDATKLFYVPPFETARPLQNVLVLIS